MRLDEKENLEELPLGLVRLLAGTLKQPTHIFIDETGDRCTGYDGDFFIFTCLATENPDRLRHAIKKTKAVLGLSGREVKSKKLSSIQRDAFLTAVAGADCIVLPYASHKPSLTTLHFEKGGSESYKAHLANALRNAAIKTSKRRTTYRGPRVPLICYPDPITPLKKDPKPVARLLQCVVSMTRANVELVDVIHTRSSREPGLQAVDVVGGAIFYRINKRQNFGTILSPIKSRIQVDQWSVFPTQSHGHFVALL